MIESKLAELVTKKFRFEQSFNTPKRCTDVFNFPIFKKTCFGSFDRRSFRCINGWLCEIETLKYLKFRSLINPYVGIASQVLQNP